MYCIFSFIFTLVSFKHCSFTSHCYKMPLDSLTQKQFIEYPQTIGSPLQHLSSYKSALWLRNLKIQVLILLDFHLLIPMYFFLITWLWLIFLTLQASLPRSWLPPYRTQRHFYHACAFQMFIFVAFAKVENFLLA